MSCLEIIGDYAFRSLGFGERLLPRSDFTLCHQVTLIGSGLIWNIYFGLMALVTGFFLATALAVALARRGRDLPVAFNRKDAKAHGEGGNLVGAPLKGRVLIVDDVITAGTAIRESVEIIRDNGAIAAGVAIALDRQERGQGELSAVQEAEADLGLSVTRIVGLSDLVGYLEQDPARAQDLEAVSAYRASYGI